jgi:hypothetical protein
VVVGLAAFIPILFGVCSLCVKFLLEAVNRVFYDGLYRRGSLTKYVSLL